MDDQQGLAERFEQHRDRLRAVAYRMLGSLAEADDAVQEAWLRLSRAGASGVDNLGAWLTTIVARVSLNMLRARQSRPEEPLGPHVPEPVIDPAEGTSPEHEALLADGVGLALLVVLQELSPAERLAYVLHDMFDVPFEQIAPMLGRTPTAARQLASRARRRVTGTAPSPEQSARRGREVVDAFFAASRAGDLAALARLLDPDVVLCADFDGVRPSVTVHGFDEVSKYAKAPKGGTTHAAWVGGLPGAIVTVHGKPFAVLAYTVVEGRIARIDCIVSTGRVRRLVGDLLDGREGPLS
jgi:RNA polymerase sigma factor (sigma-70 family)